MNRFLARPVRLPRIRPYAPKPDDPPIFWFNEEREEIVKETRDRIVEQSGASLSALQYALNDTVYSEIERLERQKDGETSEMLPVWRSLVRRISKMSESDARAELAGISERMTRDIAGNFDPRVYALATRGAPRLIATVMKPSALPSVMLSTHAFELDNLVRVEGHVEHVRELSKRGTLVVVPTHLSNLDSISLGYGLMRTKLPPLTYGAGKNLFTNPIVSFFMHNLGAYRLDRRVRATLYKDVLKAYSTVILERGYHSLFFPGGTRSRSGKIERHLKLGLAGTAIEAFARNRARGETRGVYFVPATINYSLVLEAETLIEDHLKEAGKARYIIDDDEFSQVDRWIAFFKKLRGLSAACIIRFGRPRDPFGNLVDDQGASLSPQGRILEAARYVTTRGRVGPLADRDHAYTRSLGALLADEYLRETVVMETQLVAHVLFRELVHVTPGVDLYGRLRHRGDVTIERRTLNRYVGEARDLLRGLEARDRVRLSPIVSHEEPDAIISRALAVWSGYHRRVPAREDGSNVVIEEPSVLYYYQNRLIPWSEFIAPAERAHAAHEIGALK